MAKFVSLEEGAISLETTKYCISVTAFEYKKKNGSYPLWYKSNGKIGAIKSYIDIEYLLALREKELKEYYESCDLFYFITEEMNIKQWKLSEILSVKSELFKHKRSWNSFMQSYLFSEPVKKFSSKISLRQEFYRVCTDIKKEYEWNKATIKS